MILVNIWSADHLVYNPCERVVRPIGWEPLLLGELGRHAGVWHWCLPLLRLRVIYQWGMKKTGWPQLPLGRLSVSEEGSVGSSCDEKLCEGRRGPAGLSARQPLPALTKASGGKWLGAQLEWIRERKISGRNQYGQLLRNLLSCWKCTGPWRWLQNLRRHTVQVVE